MKGELVKEQQRSAGLGALPRGVPGRLAREPQAQRRGAPDPAPLQGAAPAPAARPDAAERQGRAHL